MIVLGIETSCDETSVAVLNWPARKVLANIVLSSLKQHKQYGGVVPEIASRAHVETILPCLDLALKSARVKMTGIDLVAVTQGPGLMGSILVGLSAAKTLSFALNKPLVGVDHVIAHVYAGFLGVGARHAAPLRFPVLGLVVSGGHTVLLEMRGPNNVRVLGKTLDDAAGEAFDKVAKMLKLGYPGGPEIDRLAKGQDPGRISFTRPFLAKNSLDFSFSGIKTAVFYKIKGMKSLPKRAMAAGFQEAVCDVLVEKTLLAARKTGLGTVVIGGGVSANSRLRQKMLRGARKHGVRAVFPDNRFCQDNAAMIAALGAALYKEGKRDSLQLCGYPNFNERWK